MRTRLDELSLQVDLLSWHRLRGELRAEGAARAGRPGRVVAALLAFVFYAVVAALLAFVV